MTYRTIEDAARVALSELGLLPPKSFEPDKFHVVDAEDGRRGNGAGRVKVFADGKGGLLRIGALASAGRFSWMARPAANRNRYRSGNAPVSSGSASADRPKRLINAINPHSGR